MAYAIYAAIFTTVANIFITRSHIYTTFIAVFIVAIVTRSHDDIYIIILTATPYKTVEKKL